MRASGREAHRIKTERETGKASWGRWTDEVVSQEWDMKRTRISTWNNSPPPHFSSPILSLDRKSRMRGSWISSWTQLFLFLFFFPFPLHPLSLLFLFFIHFILIYIATLLLWLAAVTVHSYKKKQKKKECSRDIAGDKSSVGTNIWNIWKCNSKVK